MKEKQREQFGSRLGFILVSAGCAIGIGNVWKFPYLCGQYGGAAFILMYLIFLMILGIPVLICEFSIGRASRVSAARAFERLEPANSRWHWLKWISVIGCYMLMMYYTTVCGWMMQYCFLHVKGDFAHKDTAFVTKRFGQMLQDSNGMVFWTILVCVLGFFVCFFGIEKGVERVTKYMMLALLFLMLVLAFHSLILDGAASGIKFYLVPDFENMIKKGIGSVIFAAMSQAFFTLSIGIGAMLIFGSYIDKDRSLTGEAIMITVLDTFVALTAGFIIIPACFAYGIEPDAGPSLIFLTIPNLFLKMHFGRLWGAMFFVFLTFAAMSTVVAVFENIIAFSMDRFGFERKKSVAISAVLIIILSIPCALGYNALSFVTPLGEGSTILDFEDFVVSNNLLPLGSLAFVLFCTRKNGWGFDNFIDEADKGDGIRFPKSLKNYVSYVIPVIIIGIYLKGYFDMFSQKGILTLSLWLAFALVLLVSVFYCSLYTGSDSKE